MCKTISHAVYTCSLIINCILFINEHKVQNQYITEMLSKAFDKKQATQKISGKH